MRCIVWTKNPCNLRYSGTWAIHKGPVMILILEIDGYLLTLSVMYSGAKNVLWRIRLVILDDPHIYPHSARSWISTSSLSTTVGNVPLGRLLWPAHYWKDRTFRCASEGWEFCPVPHGPTLHFCGRMHWIYARCQSGFEPWQLLRWIPSLQPYLQMRALLSIWECFSQRRVSVTVRLWQVLEGQPNSSRREEVWTANLAAVDVVNHGEKLMHLVHNPISSASFTLICKVLEIRVWCWALL